MASHSTTLAAFDHRPFFDKALRHGVAQQIIAVDRVQSIAQDLAKGMIQIANYFGTAHLRPELDLALRRMVKLVSLYLEDVSSGDLEFAALSLRDKTLLSLSKGGSEMLKRLHALPQDAVIGGESVTPESQRAYLDEITRSATFSLASYRDELEARRKNQLEIDFSLWLARKMGVSRHDVDDAQALIRSAMLVLFAGKAELALPSRIAFVRLVKTARAAKAKLDEARLDKFLKNEPEEFQRLTRQTMANFIAGDLAQLRASGASADKLLYGDQAQSYFVNASVDDDVREYDRLVAKEWDRVTRGEADDPAVLASVFLLLAAGLLPKASLLLKDAKALIGNFRASGFNSSAVTGFISEHAPEALREDLQKFWEDDLKREAEQQLADSDPNWPDRHMERAVEYLRTTCRSTWKRKGW
jgi:hypothetical protein